MTMRTCPVSIETSGPKAVVGILEGLAPAKNPKRRFARYLAWRISAGYYSKQFGLKFREADRISWFIYRVNGEEDWIFLSAIERWVGEVALAHGRVDDILDAMLILAVCRIVPERVESCNRVRREVVRYIECRFGASR